MRVQRFSTRVSGLHLIVIRNQQVTCSSRVAGSIFPRKSRIWIDEFSASRSLGNVWVTSNRTLEGVRQHQYLRSLTKTDPQPQPVLPIRQFGYLLTIIVGPRDSPSRTVWSHAPLGVLPRGRPKVVRPAPT